MGQRVSRIAPKHPEAAAMGARWDSRCPGSRPSGLVVGFSLSVGIKHVGGRGGGAEEVGGLLQGTAGLGEAFVVGGTSPALGRGVAQCGELAIVEVLDDRVDALGKVVMVAHGT